MIFGCTGNYQKSDFIDIVESINTYLKERDHEMILASNIVIDRSLPSILEIPTEHIENISSKCDVLLSIGGDGTILSTVRQIGKEGIPILGIRIGHLGFLTECTLDDYKTGLHKVINDEYEITERILLEASIGNHKLKKYYGLNEISIDRGSSRILNTNIHVSGNFLNNYQSDGIIFATPTGSTAYSLSAGGPIIYPELEVITVSPVCPHSLSARPIILSSNELISITFSEDQVGMNVTIDGQNSIPVDYSQKITIRKADYTAKFITFPKNGFFERLRTKLLWSGNIK